MDLWMLHGLRALIGGAKLANSLYIITPRKPFVDMWRRADKTCPKPRRGVACEHGGPLVSLRFPRKAVKFDAVGSLQTESNQFC